MVFCSFGFLPSQVCSVIIAIVLLFTLYWGKNSIARFIAILYVCLIPLLWWYSVTYPDPVNPGLPLRLFVLFMGVMNSLQTLFDFKFLTLKVHPESDASKFAKITCGPPQMWGFIWTLLGIGIMGGFTLLGIIMFKTVQ